MYKATIRKLLRRSIDRLNEGDYQPILKMASRDVVMVFPGNNSWATMFRPAEAGRHPHVTHRGMALHLLLDLFGEDLLSAGIDAAAAPAQQRDRAVGFDRFAGVACPARSARITRGRLTAPGGNQRNGDHEHPGHAGAAALAGDSGRAGRGGHALRFGFACEAATNDR